MDLPKSDLERAKVSDPRLEWPQELRIVAQWGKNQSKHIVISKEQYFGLAPYGAPMSGDQLLHIIENLRKGKP